MLEHRQTLASQQAAWVQSLYRADSTLSRAMLVYQSNMLALAKSSLRSAYPVVSAILGGQSMDALACAHWLQSPPLRGDVHQWGDGLAAFMQAQPQLAQCPWLPDVARCEWALHRLAFAGDGQAQLQTLQCLLEHDPDTLHISLSTGWQVQNSPWPVHDIIQTHWQLPLGGAQEAGTAAADAAEQALALHALWDRVQAACICAEEPCAVLLWRNGYKPQLRACLAGEAAFLQALGQGLSLHQALECSPALAFEQWLPMAVQTGLLLQVTPPIFLDGETPCIL
ncbi:putative DNA-binding domain-containing protein [Curvibacter sp. CHRR-16]|uniref:HvfC/BufC family peptide modification chaperone n=1 Tax=Curvibacter sp. CHRR-16 TaxID=2835872 RepID=UPI001BDA4632|nr:putative DNA-binding domain-containing protein [Curvibacter sp. CHRR-16]MBT0570094.1 putative DNA-binding domain-containing protein [Curvibacter sp. CHRR-16]